MTNKQFVAVGVAGASVVLVAVWWGMGGIINMLDAAVTGLLALAVAIKDERR
jgi:hypothetical protein